MLSFIRIPSQYPFPYFIESESFVSTQVLLDLHWKSSFIPESMQFLQLEEANQMMLEPVSNKAEMGYLFDPTRTSPS